VIVDPISTGANVADEFLRRGVPCVCLTTSQLSVDLMPAKGCQLRHDFVATFRINNSSDVESVVVSLRALKASKIVSGCELAIEMCDLLSERLGLPSNGTEGSQKRREKSAMQEAIRARGLRSITQQRATCWEEIVPFLNWPARPIVIVKPVRSAGTDGVFKCTNEAEVKHAVQTILHQKNQLGGVNEACVVQEFLSGIEYIVDSVSRNGVHKIVAIWEYDKRSIGSNHFVYFGQRDCDAQSEIGRSLATYALQVLEGLDIQHGAAHAEIIMTSTGPCLVEVGCRVQGSDGQCEKRGSAVS
jgi:biotin carboxylase